MADGKSSTVFQEIAERAGEGDQTLAARQWSVASQSGVGAALCRRSP